MILHTYKTGLLGFDGVFLTSFAPGRWFSLRKWLWALHSQPQRTPDLVSSIMVGGKGGGDGCTPLPRPNNDPCPCMPFFPRGCQRHQAVVPFHSLVGRTSCWREDKRAHRREDDLHLVTNWEALVYSTIAVFFMIQPQGIKQKQLWEQKTNLKFLWVVIKFFQLESPHFWKGLNATVAFPSPRCPL